MVGNSTDDRQLFISRESGLDVSLPKHGKVNTHLIIILHVHVHCMLMTG